MKEYIDKFIRYLEFERSVSVHTVWAYKKDLEKFSEYVKTEPDKVDMIDVRGFIAEQIKRGLNKTTVSRRLASIRSFFKFLHREGYIKSKPAQLVPNHKITQIIPPVLSFVYVF